MDSYLTPKPLTPGCTLAIVAPASSPTPEALDSGIASLEAAGYRTKTYRSLTEPEGYLSGSDDDRASELMRAFQDPEVHGVAAARGGYGVARMLQKLDFAVIRQHPKALIGYSDITALHVAIDRHARLVTYHAPNVVDCLAGGGKLDQASVDRFWRVVSHAAPVDGLSADSLPTQLETIAGGEAQGRLVGGNLAVLCGLMGTGFEPQLAGRVLLLEDLGERPYRVDRMLGQLALGGKLDELAGVILGSFTACGPLEDEQSLPLRRVFEDYLGGLGIPVLSGFPAGHELPNFTLPHGAMTTLNADRQEIRFEC
ncbi:MAG: LD-carboxypeptidase [Planctomycetales bacterium]|nr:LD-carboxypeptidase [Planctomycetales bacterium]